MIHPLLLIGFNIMLLSYVTYEDHLRAQGYLNCNGPLNSPDLDASIMIIEEAVEDVIFPVIGVEGARISRQIVRHLVRTEELYRILQVAYNEKNIRIIVFFIFIFFSLNILAKEIIVSGSVQNPDARNSFPELSIYMPGEPFIKGSAQQWSLLRKGSYNKISGVYSVNIELPDNYNDVIIIAATYLDTSYNDIEAYITYPVIISDQKNISLNITLPSFLSTDDGVTIRLSHNGIEYNYTRPYRCIVTNESISAIGQMFFLSNHDYLFNRNRISNILPGKYRAYCVIKNLSASTSETISKVFDIEMPLNEINLNFDNAGEVYLEK